MDEVALAGAWLNSSRWGFGKWGNPLWPFEPTKKHILILFLIYLTTIWTLKKLPTISISLYILLKIYLNSFCTLKNLPHLKKQYGSMGKLLPPVFSQENAVYIMELGHNLIQMSPTSPYFCFRRRKILLKKALRENYRTKDTRKSSWGVRWPFNGRIGWIERSGWGGRSETKSKSLDARWENDFVACLGWSIPRS